MALKLTFYGGAETVTGSNFLVEGEKGKLLVDCGIEQGRDFCQSEMYAPFPYDVPSLDALVVTHAHLDHVGRIPKLMKEGFKGKIRLESWLETHAIRDCHFCMRSETSQLPWHILKQLNSIRNGKLLPDFRVTSEIPATS
jgi:predicted metal-dependent RNase